MCDSNKYSELLKKTTCYGVVSFSFSLAKDVGMLSTLMRAGKPLTSSQIAEETKIKDRYARELLGCLTAAGLVCVETNAEAINEYYLEDDAKAALDNGGDFALPELNYIKILMTRYDAVKECMRVENSGVVRYEQSFFDLMYEHRMKLSPWFLTRILDVVPGLRSQLEKGVDVIEFGCGSACTLITMAEMFPTSHFTATDICPENITTLRKQCSHIPQMDFHVVDLLSNSDGTLNKKYDWLYINDVIHDLPNPVEALKGMKKFMKESGSICCLVEPGGKGSHTNDAGDIFASFFYTMSTFACVPESFQKGNSEALGLGMGKDAFVNICKMAGFDMTAVDMKFNKALYYCIN